MAIHSQLSSDGSSLTIKITDKFDFSLQNDFRNSYKEQNTVSKYILDFSSTSYMDSSSLGMLLLLKQHAEQNKGSVVIHNPSEPIKKILEVANFDKIFTIS